ncbi:hypothetical protein [Flammeovirga kamogawensis]|uniref:Uncharacterized protein n=1 Tax=Flammeovirga kamogawensis TaxID=373891 RepID=A0ABX8GR87_9BACT|nr:hypothetical protein [Flammeovirga kamogawensis]MBB6463070.1 hypothetical protein [Flammeovirga kamogawensis]QWG05707.1 hypothetical protein KM029_09955 [Flammeovirga kamogawensis]TRX67535.1 hypothetical protein EO216_04985 [Flammeovirga kamogawensis]
MQNSSKYSSILLLDSGNLPINSIIYFDKDGNKISIMDNVIKISERESVEYVVLESGLEIEITKIYSVDGDISPHHTDDFFKCDCV